MDRITASHMMFQSNIATRPLGSASGERTMKHLNRVKSPLPAAGEGLFPKANPEAKYEGTLMRKHEAVCHNEHQSG